MSFKRFLIMLVYLMTIGQAGAAVESTTPDVHKEPQATTKELSGMSIVGNDEAPKSLYIVPWKSSEIGVETSFDMRLDQSPAPVDREVFLRQLAFYEVSTSDPESGKQGLKPSGSLVSSGF